MEVFINYLLESSIILGILTIFYRFVLHHEPLFKFNRIYLLFSLLLATVVPLIHISIYNSTPAETEGFTNLLDTVNVFAGDMRETVVPVIAESQSFSWIYILGAIGLLLRLLIGVVRLGGLSKKASWQKINGVKIADLPGRFNPFSFFHVIFINRSLYSDNDLDKIMVHEMAHVKHRHSIDVLLFESLLIVQWFNPFAWLVKILLKELHEFQADRSVINEGTSVSSYKDLLLYQATGARLLPVNNFNQSITKKRFKMMTNKTIKNRAFVKTLAAVAVIVSVGLFFACDNLSDDEIQDGELKSAEIEKVYDVVDIMPAYPGGPMELRKFLAKNVKYPKDAQEQGKAGRVYVQFIVSKNGKVKDVEVARSAGFQSIDDEAIRVVSAMDDWTPGMKNGKNVDVSFTVPINFTLQNENSKEPENKANKDEINKLNIGFILVDGKKISGKEMFNIPKESIQTTYIVEGDEATEKYGSEAKDGVMIITLKDPNNKKDCTPKDGLVVVGYSK